MVLKSMKNRMKSLTIHLMEVPERENREKWAM